MSVALGPSRRAPFGWVTSMPRANVDGSEFSAANGDQNVDIAGRLGIALNTVITWRKRFFEEGIDGLVDRKRSGRPRTFPPSGGGRSQGAGL